MHRLIQKLKETFLQQDIQPNPPATLAEITLFEEKYHVKLTPLLRDYFLYFNGVQAYMFGDSGLSFYSLDRFKPLNFYLDQDDLDINKYSHHFVIADMMLWCWGYAIQLNAHGDDDQVLMIHADTEKYDSFEQFLMSYLQTM